jgi:hypothetical protein
MPSYDHPDPKELDYYILQSSCIGLFEISCVLIPLIAVLDLLPGVRLRLNVSKASIVFFILGASLFVYLYFFSFFGEWLFD